MHESIDLLNVAFENPRKMKLLSKGWLGSKRNDDTSLLLDSYVETCGGLLPRP